jgi:flagellar hook-associated protein 1 FlgK
MRQSFFGFNVAISGLYTAQRNLDIINNNVSNINTPGYSRQQAVQTASRPLPMLNGTGMLGTGSEVTGINRIRDEYLDYKYWSENTSYGEWEVKKALLSELEVTFNEPSSSGFSTILDEFFNSLQELSKDPTSDSVRTLVKERGVTLAKYFNSMANHLEQLQVDINDRIEVTVDKINSLGTQIQQLNKQIYRSELDGNTANSLRDQRTLLIDELSKLINIDASEVVVGTLPNGRVDSRMVITISGKPFVDHFNLSKLEVTQREKELNEEDVPSLYEVGWEDGSPLKVKGGTLKGYLDVRDGNDGENGSPLFSGIPSYIKKLDQFVQTFAKAFNEGYIDYNNDEKIGDVDLDGDGVYDIVGNVDLDGDGVYDIVEDGTGHADGFGVGTGATKGIRFFTMLGEGNKSLSSAEFIDDTMSTDEIIDIYKNLKAKNFAVSSDILENINKIATSEDLNEVGNTIILNELIKLRTNTEMFVEGAPEDYMKAIVTTLGVNSQQAVRFAANKTVIIEQIENSRLSESGVSLDEEMANMVKQQQAYSAAAQMINAMAEIYDILINRVGL